MRRSLIAALAMTCLWVCCVVAVFAQSGRSPVEGVWEIQNITYAKPPANPVTKPTGMVIFSGNHYSIVFLTNSVRQEFPQGGVARASADQHRAVWGPLTANSGTFQVSGSTLTTRAKVAKNTFAMASGAFQESTFTLKGDTLTLISTRNDQGAVANPQTLQLVRTK